MRAHPYLRAYIAGIVVPMVLLPLLVVIDAYQQYYFEVSNQFVIPLASSPLDRAILFPMAVVPNAWGVWNMLHLWLRSRVRLSLGAFGALLVVVLIPGGIALAGLVDTFTIQWRFALPMLPIGGALYYLAWKYCVGFLNEELGIA